MQEKTTSIIISRSQDILNQSFGLNANALKCNNNHENHRQITTTADYAEKHRPIGSRPYQISKRACQQPWSSFLSSAAKILFVTEPRRRRSRVFPDFCKRAFACCKATAALCTHASCRERSITHKQGQEDCL